MLRIRHFNLHRIYLNQTLLLYTTQSLKNPKYSSSNDIYINDLYNNVYELYARKLEHLCFYLNSFKADAKRIILCFLTPFVCYFYL